MVTLQHLEDIPGHAGKVHIHAKTIVVVIAMNFLVIAQMFSILGSGLLARPIVEVMGAPSTAVWLSTSLNIGAAALNPPLSQAVDYWGRKWILVATTTSGFVGAIIVSRAMDLATVLGGFCLIAVMFGGQAASFAVVGEVLPRKYRAIGQASLTFSQSIAAIAGVLFCGALLQDGNLQNFRTYFYVVAGAFAAATASIALFYDPPPRELQVNMSQMEKLRSIDWIGILTFTIGAALFSMSLAWSNSPYSWSDAHILSTFIPGLILLLVFCFYEWKFKQDGIAHHGLFADRNYACALIAAFIEGLAVFTMNSYLTLEGIELFDMDFFQGSARYAMIYVYAILLVFLSGWYITHFKAIKGVLVFAQTSVLIMCVLMATVKPGLSANALWGYPVMGGLGIGCITTAIFVAAQLSVGGELIALGTGLVAASRALGGMIGLVVNNAIFNGALNKKIPPEVAAVVLPLGLKPSNLASFITALTAGNTQALTKIPGVTPAMIDVAAKALKQAYSVAFSNVWIAAACFSVPGIVVACFLRNPTDAFNTHIDAPIEAELVKIQAETEGRINDETGYSQAETKEHPVDASSGVKG